MLRRQLGWVLLGAWFTLWLTARPCQAEGPGLMLGDRIVVHAGFATELRYDSNVFFSNGRLGNGLPIGAFLLRILPSVDLSTLSLRHGGLSAHTADFRVHVGLDYREYLTPDTTVAEHRALGVELGGLLMLFPRGALNIDLYDNYLRTNQPPYSYNPYNIDRDTNVLGVRFRYSPGGRRLQISLIYELSFDGFENVDNGPRLSGLDLLSNSVVLRGSWKFLPKTALFIELSQQFVTYLDTSIENQNLRSGSYPFRAEAGVMGLITQKLAVNLQGGYGNGFYVRGPSPSTGIIAAQVRYKPTYLASATLDYHHDFANSLVGSYFDQDSVGLSYSHLISRVTLFGHVSYERMAFQGTPEMLLAGGICKNGELMPCDPQTDRVDNFLSLELRAEMPIRDWLIPAAGYGLQSNVSNGYSRVQSVTTPAITPVSYTKHEAWLRLTVRY